MIAGAAGVRPGLPASIAAHGALLAAAVVVLPRTTPPLLPPSPVIPVEIVARGPTTSVAAQAPDAPEIAEEAPAAEAQPEPEPAPSLTPQTRPMPVAAEAAPKAAPTRPPTPAARAEPAARREREAAVAPPAARPQPNRPAPQTAPATPAPARAQPAQGLDLDRIEALADQAEDASPRRAPQMQTAQGQVRRGERRAAVGMAGALSIADADALRSQVSRCWRAPADLAEADRLIVEVRLQLERSGALVGEPRVVRPSGLGGADPRLRAAAESAVRAVKGCAPFDLSPERYESWRDVVLNFDPRLMAAAG